MILPIQSSMFSHIGYDADSMTLTVRYHPSKKQTEGDLWTYAPVVSEKWDEMQAVAKDPKQSLGKWFRANIAGQYEGKKIIPEIPETYGDVYGEESR